MSSGVISCGLWDHWLKKWQPDFLTSRNQGFGQIRQGVEQKPPLSAGEWAVERLKKHAGGNVVEHREPLDEVGVILGQA
jgi:hypothetical protein